MPYEITFDNVPIGYAAQSHRAEEPNALVCYRQFVSSEDGDTFVKLLEGYPDEVLRMIGSPAKILPSTVDHMLVIVRKDKSATVYVNEITFMALARPRRAVKKGEPGMSQGSCRLLQSLESIR